MAKNVARGKTAFALPECFSDWKCDPLGIFVIDKNFIKNGLYVSMFDAVPKDVKI